MTDTPTPETFDAKVRNVLALLMPEAPEQTELVISRLTNLYDSRQPVRDFTGTYKGRSIPELAWLAQTLGALHSVLMALEPSITAAEPALRETDNEFMRLLEQNLMYIRREILAQSKAKTEEGGTDGQA